MVNPSKGKAKAKPAARLNRTTTRGQKAKPVDPGGMNVVPAEVINADSTPAAGPSVTASDARYVVRGMVTNADKSLADGLIVRAFDCDLRHEELLGETTAKVGLYQIPYLRADFSHAEKESADLRVRVYAADGKAELASSDIVFNAQTDQDLDVQLPEASAGKLSLWEHIAQVVSPLLADQGSQGGSLLPRELDDRDFDFIVKESGLDREQLRVWALADKFAAEFQLISPQPLNLVKQRKISKQALAAGAGRFSSEGTDELLERICFFGWFLNDQPQSFDLLVRRQVAVLLAALDRAVALNHIPTLDDKAKAVVAQALGLRRVVEEIKPTPKGEPASLGGALRTMPLAARLALDDAHGLGAQVVSLLIDERSQDGSQWQQIRDLVDDDALFNSVRRTVGLTQLTGGHVPLIEALQQSDVSDTAASLADLVELDRNQWIELAKKHGVPKGIEAETEELRAMRFGQQIAQGVEAMNPAAFINHRVLAGQIPVAAEIQKPLAEFLTVNPSLRIKDGSVLAWLGSDQVKTGGLSKEQVEKLTPELLKLERVAKIAPSLEHVGLLLKSGYESGRDIVMRHSREVFVNEMRDLIGSETEAGQIHDAAAGVVATTNALVLAHSPRFSGIDLPVMPSSVRTVAKAAPGGMVVRSLTRSLLSANLQRLFGSQDYCECAHGASLYGPAAYLADLLHMLGQGRVNPAGLTALQVLLSRRPDLAEIDLTADNTDITLPYIDLVLEILEAPPIRPLPRFRQSGVSPANGFDGILANGTVPDAMKNDLAALGIQLGDDHDVHGAADGPWRIRDRTSGVKYRLAHSMAARYYDLAAFPQSVAGGTQGYRPWSSGTSTVVQNVGAVTFPWKLPFDSARDEANTWLEDSGATRSELMQAMSADRWNDIEVACEYLNLSPAERRIFNAVPVADYKDWGFASALITSSTEEIVDPIAGAVGKYDSTVTTVNKVRWKSAGPDRFDPPDWHALLKNVSLLRSRARLTHRELLNVLETRFVRGGPARLEITGKECDTALMRLEAMNAAIAHRIHVFVRLWRKLGWSTVDLDRAIYAYGVGTLVRDFDLFSDPFLLFVANVARLHDATGLPISQLLDLFGASSGGPQLDTTEYWSHTGALPLRTLTRYQERFDNPNLGKPQQPEFRLDASRNALAPVVRPTSLASGLSKPRISDHLPYVAAALAMPEEEVRALLPAGADCIRPVQLGTQRGIGIPIEVRGAASKQIEIVLGANSTGATFEVLVQSGANSDPASPFTSVPASELQGSSANPITIISSTGPLTRLTYTGTDKYLTCEVTQTAGSNPGLWVTVRILTQPGVVTDELTLANLTVLCRYAVLRRIIGVPVKDLRMLMSLSGFGSLSGLDSPEKVLALLDARRSLNTLSVSISQADELLLGPSADNGIELDARAEALLGTVRAEDQAIRSESVVSDSERSGLLRNVLTTFGWDERLIADVLGAEGLDSSFGDYEAALDTRPILPTPLTLPTSLTYSTIEKRLIAPRSAAPAALRDAVATLLTAMQISGNPYADLRAALRVIWVEAGRRADLLAWMRAVKLPVHRARVAAVPVLRSGIPAEWKGRFYYDYATAEICLVGWMKRTDTDALKALEVPGSPQTAPSFANAIDALYQSSEDYRVTGQNRLVAPGSELSYETLLLGIGGLQARSGLILERLLPGWRQQKLHAAVSSTLSQEVGISVEAATALLALPCAAERQSPSFESLLLDVRLLESDPATKPTRTAFGSAFVAAARCLVLGKLLLQLKMDAAQVPWLGGVWDGLDLTALPTQRESGSSTAWNSVKALSSLASLRGNVAIGAAGLQRVLAATAPTSTTIAFQQVSSALGCSEDTLRVFAGAEGLNINAPAWFRAPAQLARVVDCLVLARRVNSPAGLFVEFKRAQMATRPPQEADAEVQAVRQMALGRSTDSGWTDTERKVLDGIRQRRRDATVDYLVQEHGALDANDLYGLYLIDPQMNPCMMTSRIKQGISSVQLFIQRCLMNLEPDAPASMIEVKSWEKYYRIWEANRKVLLYPENWIEPELRDDKTPFFDDVVSSLQQGDATSDKAQLAVQTFLERLSDLSKMDVVATCSDYDDAGRLLVTHVFASTLAEPRTYWHRQFIKQDVKDRSSSLGRWTAWQPIDLDIEGDHLFPIIWKGRLFLFWGIFSEKAKEPTNAELQPNQGKPPAKFWQLKLAWSEFKSGKWGGKKLSASNLISPGIWVEQGMRWFYFRAITNELGVTIRVYHETALFSTLYFDGNYVRFASGYGSTGLTWVLPDTVETPIDQTQSTAVTLHSNMKIDVIGNTSASIELNGIQKTFGGVLRSRQLLYSPAQGKAVFAAPRPTDSSPFSRTIPFALSDWVHKFLVYPSWQPAPRYTEVGPSHGGGIGVVITYIDPYVPNLNFYALDWPQSTRLRNVFADSGIEKLLSYDSQVEKQDGFLGYFAREYSPSAEMAQYGPSGDLEFSAHSATAQYNWELFFHVPFSIACGLGKNQRFEEARRWFHYIFDPTDYSTDQAPERYWRFRPFRNAAQGLRIDELARRLADPSDHSQEKSDFKTLIAMWKEQPFQPHLVARLRIRSYMYTVVMKYLDNLIAWGDQLFRRETLESLNEATQLYILAAQILGRRPEGIPRRTRPVVKSFAEFAQPDDLGNALVEAENLVPSTSSTGGAQSQGTLKSLYFCVPNNPRLLEYYDRVEDRLFKLRNCMNIDGVVRHLPLFEPEIDPSLLVRAAAAGVDVASVLADLNAPLPSYRFSVMAQKATELCSEVKGLGAALLSALEKGDAEALALMRSGHELQMLQRVRLVKELQLHEAKANIDSIGVSLESAQTRFTHYFGLISQLESPSIPTTPVATTIQALALAAISPLTSAASFVQSSAATVSPIVADSTEKIKQILARTAEALSATLPPDGSATEKVPMNAAEKRQLSEMKSAHDLQKKAMDQRLVAQLLAKIPDFTLGAQGWTSSPVVQFTLGGTLLSMFTNLSASILDTEASEHTYRAGLHSTLAGYQRRTADWLLQAELAAKDIEQISKQIAASCLRIAIASQELRNHDLQAENARAVDEFMHSKYSNLELYNWISGQLSNLHFQSYQLAYDVAKRAERCFKHELGVDSTFIGFGYWDNLKKGLLAGENLHADLKRMEVAYLNQNSRELEITKHVSLRQLDAEALLRLRAEGGCEFDIPEWLFDLDFPGHYFRRIKSVSVSVPCVVGPYAGVSGTLTLLSSATRAKPALASGASADPNVQRSYLQTQSIATSTAQNDSGLFELNFRDERYLPFEGAGAISRWQFKLPSDFRAFDYDTISDLVVHVRYTARDGGQPLAVQSVAALNTRLTDAAQSDLCALISVKRDFPTEWAQFNSRSNGTLKISLTEQYFPYLFRSRIVAGPTAQQLWLEDKALQRADVEVTAGSANGTWEITFDEVPDDPYLLVPYSLN